jgi:hypothetical protein
VILTEKIRIEALVFSNLPDVSRSTRADLPHRRAYPHDRGLRRPRLGLSLYLATGSLLSGVPGFPALFPCAAAIVRVRQKKITRKRTRNSVRCPQPSGLDCQENLET